MHTSGRPENAIILERCEVVPHGVCIAWQNDCRFSRPINVVLLIIIVVAWSKFRLSGSFVLADVGCRLDRKIDARSTC